jgi:hypothetical protein
MRIGDRIEAVLTVAGISHYEIKDRYNDRSTILYRHSFRDSDNRLYVYSGIQLRIRTGERVRLRGTVKRFENDYGMVRLSRIKLIETGLPEGLL